MKGGRWAVRARRAVRAQGSLVPNPPLLPRMRNAAGENARVLPRPPGGDRRRLFQTFTRPSRSAFGNSAILAMGKRRALQGNARRAVVENRASKLQGFFMWAPLFMRAPPPPLGPPTLTYIRIFHSA